jgi:hypothetical protein
MGATTANAFVYPYTLHQLGLWKAASAVLFAVGLATTAWIVRRSLDAPAGTGVGMGRASASAPATR